MCDLTGECPPCFYGDLVSAKLLWQLNRRVSAMLLW